MGLFSSSRIHVTPALASYSVNILLAIVVMYYSLLGFPRPSTPLWTNFDVLVSGQVSQSAAENYKDHPIDFENATTIFNSVYGALKQKDANINPVGVTFIPAYLPPNTMMYHSTGSSELPESFEWIAMDYEFSYAFASFQRGKRRGPGGPGGPHKGPPGHGSSRKTPPDSASEAAPLGLGKNQVRGPPSRGKLPFGDGPHYLFTFKNTKPLDRLIFLDGASAAKTETGEMDQQLILSNQKDIDARVDERSAAQEICKWGKSFGLQGYVRLEVGYEIVLCDFHTDIELVSNITLSNVTSFIGFPGELPDPENNLARERSHLMDVYQASSRFDWARAGSDVNDGEPRILLDYSKMVTPVNKTWISADPYQRRINNISSLLKHEIRTDLANALSAGASPFKTTHWPQIIGHIMDKFSPILHDLNSTLALFDYTMDDNLPQSLEYAAGNITRAAYNLVRRYTDENIKNTTERVQQAHQVAIEDYVHSTFPVTSKSDALIFSATYKVTDEVVKHVFDLFYSAKAILADFVVQADHNSLSQHKDSLLEHRAALISLLKTLKWSSFVRCSNACNWDEVCYVPTWGPGPVGWGMEGNSKYLHYEHGSLRVNSDLQCIKLDVRT